jgi:mRNA-degrading endonuclease RelE of RelBE toxin-antitoxin system
MYRIELTPGAQEDLASFRKFDQKRIVAGIEEQPRHEPTRAARDRERLRPTALADWEVRVDEFRIFYDLPAVGAVVRIVAIGFKIENDLSVHGERYEP